MLTIDEALCAVLDASRPLPARPEPLDRRCGCVLGEDVPADIDLPPFDKALVDGYAVRSGDLRRPRPPASAGRDDPGRPDADAGRWHRARPRRS